MVAVGFRRHVRPERDPQRVLGALGLPPVDLMFTLEAIVIAHAFYNAPLVARVTTAAGVGRRECGRDRSEPRRGADPGVFRRGRAAGVSRRADDGAALTFVFTFGTFPIVLALGGSS